MKLPCKTINHYKQTDNDHFSWQTDRHTLHHNIYIITIIIQLLIPSCHVVTRGQMIPNFEQIWGGLWQTPLASWVTKCKRPSLVLSVLYCISSRNVSITHKTVISKECKRKLRPPRIGPMQAKYPTPSQCPGHHGSLVSPSPDNIA